MGKMKISSSLAWLISMSVGVAAFIFNAYKPTSELALLYGFLGGLTTFYGYRRYKLKTSNEKTEGS